MSHFALFYHRACMGAEFAAYDHMYLQSQSGVIFIKPVCYCLSIDRSYAEKMPRNSRPSNPRPRCATKSTAMACLVISLLNRYVLTMLLALKAFINSISVAPSQLLLGHHSLLTTIPTCLQEPDSLYLGQPWLLNPNHRFSS